MEPTLRGINPQPQPQSRVTVQARPPCLPGSLLTCVAGCCVARPRSRRRIKGSAGRDKNFFHMSASKLHGKPEAAAEGQCPSQRHGSRLQGGLPHSLPRVPCQLINEGTATLPLPCCAQPRCQLSLGIYAHELATNSKNSVAVQQEGTGRKHEDCDIQGISLDGY